MKETAEKPYRSISEVSRTMGIKAHVLRYWETQFSMLRPRKNRAGVRMYRPKDLELLREIRHLLYDRGFTIAGARRKLLSARKAEEARGQQEIVLQEGSKPLLREIEAELRALHALLTAPRRTAR